MLAWPRLLSALGAGVLSLGGGAAAQQAVSFEDGRTLEVRSVAVDGDMAWLDLPGGGRLAVPVERISGIHTIEVDPPPAVIEEDPASAGEPWRTAAGPYAEVIGSAAARYDLDPALLTSLARVESSLDPGARSPKGACGLLQLMPQTAARFGVTDVFDPSENVDGGARYLSWLLERYDGRAELALAGYNAGEGAVDRYRGIPPYAETQAYVARVLDGASRLAR
jgi:hypothetical protein